MSKTPRRNTKRELRRKPQADIITLMNATSHEPSIATTLRTAIRESEHSLASIERNTGVQRHRIMRFLLGESSLGLDDADRLAGPLGVVCQLESKNTRARHEWPCVRPDVNTLAHKSRKRERIEELLRIAGEHNVLEVFQSFVVKLGPFFDSSSYAELAVTYCGRIASSKSGVAMMVVAPGESQPNRGIRMRVQLDHICEFFDIERDALLSALPGNEEFQQDCWTKEYHSGFVSNNDDLEQLCQLLSEAREEQHRKGE